MSDASSTRAIRKHLMYEHKIALLLVALVGLLGSTYVLSSISNSDFEQDHAIIHMEQLGIDKLNAVLKLQGKKYAGEEILFTISNYNPDLRYTIDFGDGKIQTIETNHFSYNYAEEGDYHVTLVANVENSEIVLEDMNLRIENQSLDIINP